MEKRRIFAASPSDMTTERTKVDTAASLLKPLADHLGIMLDVVDWRSVVPDMGRPEQVILDQLQPTSWDVFIGILWHRFGTPPGGQEPQTQVASEVVQTFVPKLPNNLPRRAPFFGRDKGMGMVLRTLSPEDRTWGVLVDGTTTGTRGAGDLRAIAIQRCSGDEGIGGETEEGGRRTVGSRQRTEPDISMQQAHIERALCVRDIGIAEDWPGVCSGVTAFGQPP